MIKKHILPIILFVLTVGLMINMSKMLYKRYQERQDNRFMDVVFVPFTPKDRIPVLVTALKEVIDTYDLGIKQEYLKHLPNDEKVMMEIKRLVDSLNQLVNSNPK